jgi:septal ring-binding cell division protein DamX
MPARVYFRIESRGGRPWYVVFYGLYPDATAAAAAKADLAAELATLKPIVRPLAAGDQLHFLDRAP